MNRLVLVTRMGIGVFDPRWWEARLALFDAITAPSVATVAATRDVEWALLLDQDLPREIYGKLRDIMDKRGLSTQARYSWVPDHSYTREAMRTGVLSAARPTERIWATLLDDDDAISSRMYNAFDEALDPDFCGPQVMSQRTGLALDAPGSRVWPDQRVSYPVNTAFHGTPDEIFSVMRVSHTQWLERAQKTGGRGIMLAHDEPMWGYTLHLQADGSYEARTEGLANRSAAPMSDEHSFLGLDLQALDRWRQIQATTPPTIGLTWRRTQPQALRLGALRREARSVKRKAITINSDIFNPDVPFFYVLRPNPESSFRAGPVTITGVGTPGTTIELSLRGAGDTYKPWRTTEVDADGNWNLKCAFKAFKWSARIDQTADGKLLNRAEFFWTVR